MKSQHSEINERAEKDLNVRARIQKNEMAKWKSRRKKLICFIQRKQLFEQKKRDERGDSQKLKKLQNNEEKNEGFK